MYVPSEIKSNGKQLKIVKKSKGYKNMPLSRNKKYEIQQKKKQITSLSKKSRAIKNNNG